MKTVFSPCRKYRYTLWREWDSLIGGKYCMFVGLNPSTADEVTDDPTIRRCIGFAKRWGYGAVCMTNLFAFRSTDPMTMLACADPVGPDNDKWLVEIAKGAGIVVAAWGTHGDHLGRGKIVRMGFMQHGINLQCLGHTKDGYPRHPLYLRGDCEPCTYAAC